jgi:hypothetical protein
MKLTVIISLCVLLSACVTVPVDRNFPPAPASLLTPCPELETVPDNTVLLSSILSVITKNYTKYHGCQEKTQSWIDWYQQQQQIFNTVR